MVPVLRRRAVRHAKEPIEDMVQVFGRDGRPVVANLRDRQAVPALDTEPDLATGRRVAHRIVDEVHERLGEPIRVGDDRHRPVPHDLDVLDPDP